MIILAHFPSVRFLMHSFVFSVWYYLHWSKECEYFFLHCLSTPVKPVNPDCYRWMSIKCFSGHMMRCLWFYWLLVLVCWTWFISSDLRWCFSLGFMKNFFGSSWVKLHPTGTPSRLNQTLILQVDLGQVLAQTHLDPVSVFCHLQLQSRILSCQSSPHPPLHPGSVEPPSTRSEHQTSTMMALSDLLKPVETVRTEVSIYHLSWMKNHNH